MYTSTRDVTSRLLVEMADVIMKEVNHKVDVFEDLIFLNMLLFNNIFITINMLKEIETLYEERQQGSSER